MNSSFRGSYSLSIAAIGLVFAVSCALAGHIWDGGSETDSNWNTADNWESNILPGFGRSIIFAGTARAANVNDLAEDATIGGIQLGNTTPGQAFLISGNRITLGGDITTTASSGEGITDTIGLAMIFDGNRTIATNAAHHLTVVGSIGEIGGARQLIKSGAGTLTLSGYNSYSGVTAISSGVLTISHPNALGTTAGHTTIAATGAPAGPTLQLSGGIASPENITITGGTEKSGFNGAIRNISDNNTLSGNIILSSPTSGIRFDAAAGTLTFSGRISQTGSDRTLVLAPASSSTITINNPIANNDGRLTVACYINGTAGTVVLKGVNPTDGTGIGSTLVFQGTTLKLGISDALNTGRDLLLGDTHVNTFDLANFNQTVRGLVCTRANTGRVQNSVAGTSTLTVGNGGGNHTYSGTILAGPGKVALVKIGEGTQTLSGANTYAGFTEVKQGILLINGNQAAAGGPVSVAADATLGGNGVIGGATIFTGASIHAPGGAPATVGTQTFSRTLTYGSGTIFTWDIDVTGDSTSTYDKVTAAGAVKGDGVIFRIVLATGDSFADAFWNTNRSWTDIFGGAGAPANLASIFSGFDPSGGISSTGVVTGQGQFTLDGKSNSLKWTPLP